MRGIISTLRRTLSIVRDQRGRIILAQFAMLLGTAAGLLLPLLLGAIFDGRYPLEMMVGCLLGVGVISAGAGYAKGVLTGAIGHTVSLRLRMRVYGKLQRLPQAYFAARNSGDILSTLLNDIRMFTDVLSSGIVYVAEMAVSLVAAVLLLMQLDMTLTLAFFAVLLPILAVLRRMGQPVAAVSAQAQQSMSEVTDVLSQSLGGMDVIKTYALGQRSEAIFGAANARWYTHAFGLTRMKARSGLLAGLLTSIAVAVLVGLGAWRVGLGLLTIGTLTSFMLYAQGLVGPLSSLSGLYLDARAAFAAIDRVYAILDAQEEPSGQAALSPPIGGRIAMDGVHFAYTQGTDVLRGVTLTIEPGQHVAFVGASGAGKTTLLSLLLGHYRPAGGRILLDGQDITALDVDVLRAQTAVVSQTPFLFDLTIRDNIRCGNLQATDAQVEAAARRANADAFIRALPAGYDTVVGERGAALSGGQRQRIAIARAFLKDAPILLLDEATSALDNATERQVKEAIGRLMAGRTTITVAHRLTTVEDADVIFYLQDGRVSAFGDHRTLLASCPPYAALCRGVGTPHRVMEPS